MADTLPNNGVHKEANSAGQYPNGAGTDNERLTRNMTHEEHEAAKSAARFGYGPLAKTSQSSGAAFHPAFGGEFQPGTFRSVSDRKFANPAPLGLSAFALTTFLLSLINVGTRGIAAPNIVVASAFGYGGLVQLLAGMWEMAVGNTFGATALSSYGGFWISFAITLTPGGFGIVEALGGGADDAFLDSFGIYLMGWFIFTTILLIATLRSTVAFFLLFFTLDMAFMLLGIGYLSHAGTGAPNVACNKAGGVFGLLAAFLAWYNALAGILDDSNSFFQIPVAHFPWSAKGRERKEAKVAGSTA